MRWTIPFLCIGVMSIAQPPSTGHDEPGAPVSVDYDRDIKPILAKHCYTCHGSDKQKGGLRLDRKADAIRGGDSGAAIVAGKPIQSPLLQRVRSRDETDMMPPRGERLSANEVAKLQAWIEQGAKWPDDGSSVPNPADWWSLKPIVKPAIPVDHDPFIRNPVDAFVLAVLRDRGLSPSPEADRRTLIRRLSFDLLGLPPTPEDIEAFVNDPAPDAWERLVDRWLASPHYGERWARHWLDVVHFGETHGYDKDKPRPHAWPYRDYVIRSFNSDKPYDRFVQEQLAGDVLFPGTTDGIEGLGFLAAGPWDYIGHAELPETKIDGKVARHLDRDDFVSNTMSTFMGLTVHCAQCHNHKFDPITQEDYYSLQAVFAAIDRTDRAYDVDQRIARQRAALESKHATVNARIIAIEQIAQKSAGKELTDLEQQIALASQPASASVRPEFGYHSAIAKNADTVKWVQVDLGASHRLDRVVLRPCHDTFNGIGAGFGFPVRYKVELSDDASFQAGVITLADRTVMDGRNPGLTPDSIPVAGKPGRYIRITATRLAPRQNDFIFALAELEAFDSTGKNVARDAQVTSLDSIEAPIRWRRSNLTDGIYPVDRSSESGDLSKLQSRRETLLAQSLTPQLLAELQTLRRERETVDVELKQLGQPARTAYIGAVHSGTGSFVGTGATGGKPRPIHILTRGDVTRPGPEVGPGAIRAIPGLNGRFNLPANHREGDRRSALAQWITDRANPLTWRVMVNRVWQYHFGRGIVETPNDFGVMGQPPTHPKLLDWLAAEFRDNGMSLKKLHRIILTSSTYRQASGHRPPAGMVDGDNRYYWRQNRRKLEAEAVRDCILFVSGKLDLTMGGPSFQDFVIEKPEHSPHYQYHLHDPEDPKSHRRAVYRFIVRSKQQPFMAALDCADPSLAVDRRNQTMTSQQALALLNNRLAVVMAKHFAHRVEQLAKDDASRVKIAFVLALGRSPTPTEQTQLIAYMKEYGLPNVCRVILNLNEFIFVD